MASWQDFRATRNAERNIYLAPCQPQVGTFMAIYGIAISAEGRPTATVRVCVWVSILRPAVYAPRSGFGAMWFQGGNGTPVLERHLDTASFWWWQNIQVVSAEYKVVKIDSSQCMFQVKQNTVYIP